MKAVILAAGYATRLYPLTIDKPKCLLPIGETTILDILCDKIARAGTFNEIILVTNQRFFEKLSQWKSRADHKLPVTILNDGSTSNEDRLGAVGDFGFVIRECKIDTDVLLLASDNLFESGFRDFIQFAKNKNEITVALHDIGDPLLASKKYGVAELDTSGAVTRIEEKPEHPRSSLIGMGVYFFPKASLKFVPEYLAQKDAKDAPGFYVTWLLSRFKIFGFRFSGLWYDIGDLKSLEEADRFYKTDFKKGLV